MSFRTSLFLALRYLQPRRSFTTISTALSMLGPIIGVAVLVVVISVMNGFHEQIRERFFGLTSHILADNWGQAIEEPEKQVKALEKLGFKATPVISTPSIIQVRDRFAVTGDDNASGQVIYHSFIGIDPKTDPGVTEIRKKCIVTAGAGANKKIGNFQKQYDELKDGEVLCGLRFLQTHGLRVGDKVVVHPIGKLEDLIEYKPDGTIEVKQLDNAYVPVELKVIGAFSFDMYQFDSDMSFISLDQAAELKGLEWGQATQIKVKTDDPFRYPEYIANIREGDEFDSMRVWSWRDENENFFQALQTEKSVMFILLVLIVVVSAFCVCATLITIVFQKTHEIGILKAMGAHPATIMTIFFIQGGFIGFVGVGGGTLLGLGLVAIRNWFLAQMRGLFGQDLMPQALYFFKELPAEVRWEDIAMVDVSAFVLCVLAGVIPALMAMFISPGRAIKGE